jgi:hypothetical protein
MHPGRPFVLFGEASVVAILLGSFLLIPITPGQDGMRYALFLFNSFSLERLLGASG